MVNARTYSKGCKLLPREPENWWVTKYAKEDNRMKTHSANKPDLYQEVSNGAVLIVEPDLSERNMLRESMNELGFPVIAQATNHKSSLDKFEGRKFTHIIFDATKDNYPIQEWFSEIIDIDPNITAIPTSANPKTDDVFELLVLGARGYLVKPFTRETVHAAVSLASKGEPIPDIVKSAKDRNEALVAMMMSSLDRLATVQRQARQFQTAQRELAKAEACLRQASELAHIFAKDGEEGLLEALERFCVNKCRGPATRLGRLRKRLSKTRLDEDSL